MGVCTRCFLLAAMLAMSICISVAAPLSAFEKGEKTEKQCDSPCISCRSDDTKYVCWQRTLSAVGFSKVCVLDVTNASNIFRQSAADAKPGFFNIRLEKGGVQTIHESLELEHAFAAKIAPPKIGFFGKMWTVLQRDYTRFINNRASRRYLDGDILMAQDDVDVLIAKRVKGAYVVAQAHRPGEDLSAEQEPGFDTPDEAFLTAWEALFNFVEDMENREEEEEEETIGEEKEGGKIEATEDLGQGSLEDQGEEKEGGKIEATEDLGQGSLEDQEKQIYDMSKKNGWDMPSAAAELMRATDHKQKVADALKASEENRKARAEAEAEAETAVHT